MNAPNKCTAQLVLSSTLRAQPIDYSLTHTPPRTFRLLVKQRHTCGK
jgi:hypothetical protein